MAKRVVGNRPTLLALWVLGVSSLLVLPVAGAFFTRGHRKQALAIASLAAAVVTGVGAYLKWYEPAAWHAPAKGTHATTAAIAFGLCAAGIEIAAVIVLNARQTSQLYWRISDPRDQGGAVAGYLATYLLPLLSFDAHGWNSVGAYGIYLLVVYVIFEANGLVLRQAEIVRENRDLERYLDLAGCRGDERERARQVAPRGTSAEIGWYVLHKPGF